MRAFRLGHRGIVRRLSLRRTYAMRIGPEKALPLPPEFQNVDTYVDSLLHFSTSSWLLQTLCGGVHILDFFTREPDIYEQILPRDWRDWVESQNIMTFLDLLMRDDLNKLISQNGTQIEQVKTGSNPPPPSLIQYIHDIRRHLLDRSFKPLQATPTAELKNHRQGIPMHIAVGMKDKKAHEVNNFARFVDRLTSDITASRNSGITHLIDFGSGQNYLGRALASSPYNKHMIAVESKPHNIEGSKDKDVVAKLVKKEMVMRNKKQHRTELYGLNSKNGYRKGELPKQIRNGLPETGSPKVNQSPDVTAKDERTFKEIPSSTSSLSTSDGPVRAKLDIPQGGKGSVQYVTHRIQDGDLSAVIDQIVDTDSIEGPADDTSSRAVETSDLVRSKVQEPNLMTISLHSCGNLLHHGLRTLTLNPNVTAICMVGCCYNLVTERLGAPSFKLPFLRPNHPRLVATSSECDPHGFPMSKTLEAYPMPALIIPQHITDNPSVNINSQEMANHDRGEGIHLNITARMMAVQAPQNWGASDSDGFFTRHFYRALLQRVFLDLNLIPPPTATAYTMCFNAETPVEKRASQNRPPRSPAGTGSGGDPIIIGTLKKSAYSSFIDYVRTAGEKLASTTTSFNHHAAANPKIAAALATLTDDQISEYEEKYAHRKKHLSVVWSLMAYSAGVVECMMVVDRWLWLKEQKEVQETWVEAVFDYAQSPRNLCIVGIKK